MYGVPATPVSCSRPNRPPATTPGSTPRRTAMNRIGSISSPNDPPCGMRSGKAWAIQLSTAARAMATPISAMARTPQCAGLRFRRVRMSGVPADGCTSGVLTMTSLPSLALPSSARRRRRPGGRSGSTRRRQEAPSQPLTRELRKDQDSVPQRPCAPPCVSHPRPSIHRTLCRMWISRFCHALRLTIAVDKALTTLCSLDTATLAHSPLIIPVLQRNHPRHPI